MKRKFYNLIVCTLVAASSFGADAPGPLTIKKTTKAPVIDGILEADVWDAVPAQKMEQANGSVDGFAAEFKMTYDATNLYVAVKVTDPTPGIGGPSTWNSDCVELFFAMDTNSATAYRKGDWQLRRTHYQEGADTMTDGSSNVTAEVKAVMKVNETDGVQEWSLPWLTLKQDTINFDGKNFRFDVQAAQANEEIVGRVGQLFWHSNADDQWNKIKSQGLISIECHCDPDPFPIQVKETKSEINIFPNPVSKFLNIKSTIVFNSYEIYNLSNMRISGKKAQSGTFQVDMDNYPSGGYIIKLFAEDGSVMNKFVVKK